MGKAPQRAPKQYSGPEPMDLSGTKENRKFTCRKCGKPGHYANNCRSGRKPEGQRPNQGFQKRKTFKRSPQQEKWFKDGACMNYEKRGHYARDCRDGQSTNTVKGTTAPREVEEFKGTRGYAVKYFTFYYNNQC